MATKVVKTITITGFGTRKIVEAPVGTGAEVDDVVTTTLDDAVSQMVPAPQPKQPAINFLMTYDGTLPAPGATATLTFAPSDEGGSAIGSTVSCTGYIKSAVPVDIVVGGERRAVQRVAFQPSGATFPTTSP